MKDLNNKKGFSGTVHKKTMYYRVTYSDVTGNLTDEVIMNDTMDHAMEYAAGDNARGRTVVDIREYSDWRDAVPLI